MQSNDFCDQLLIEIQTAQDAEAELQDYVSQGNQQYEKLLTYLTAYIEYLWDLYNVMKTKDIYEINTKIESKLTSLKKYNEGIDRTVSKIQQINNITYFISELLKAVNKFGV